MSPVGFRITRILTDFYAQTLSGHWCEGVITFVSHVSPTFALQPPSCHALVATKVHVISGSSQVLIWLCDDKEIVQHVTLWKNHKVNFVLWTSNLQECEGNVFFFKFSGASKKFWLGSEKFKIFFWGATLALIHLALKVRRGRFNVPCSQGVLIYRNSLHFQVKTLYGGLGQYKWLGITTPYDFSLTC